jgi:hypothetical protein
MVIGPSDPRATQQIIDVLKQVSDRGKLLQAPIDAAVTCILALKIPHGAHSSHNSLTWH